MIGVRRGLVKSGNKTDETRQSVTNNGMSEKSEVQG